MSKDGERPIQVGDRYQIEVEVRDQLSDFGFYLVTVVPHRTFELTAAELRAGKFLPRPLKVGDRVRWGSGGGAGTIIAVSEPTAEAWCLYKEGNGITGIFDLSDLQRIP
jgi:hypothetical protein